MKKGQIVRINHPAFGEYGLVAQTAEDVVVIMAATGIPAHCPPFGRSR